MISGVSVPHLASSCGYGSAIKCWTKDQVCVVSSYDVSSSAGRCPSCPGVLTYIDRDHDQQRIAQGCWETKGKPTGQQGCVHEVH